MPSFSSDMRISSSDRKGSRGTALWVAVLATAVVFSGLQLAAHRLRLHDPDSPIAARIELLSRRDAELLVLGSSRLYSCIDERTVEESLGLGAGKALNLAGNGLHPYDALVIAREAERAGVLGAEMAIVELEPSQFNIHARSPITGAVLPYPVSMKLWATWSERTLFPSAARPELVRSLFAPLALRRSLPDWMHFFSSALSPERAALPRPRYHHEAEARATLENDGRFAAASISKLHFGRYRFSEYLWNRFQALLDLFERRGIRVVVFSPPARNVYWDYARREADVAQGYGDYKKKVEGLRRRVDVIEWDTASDAGLDESIFVDYGHCNLEGSRLLTRRLSAELIASSEAPATGLAGGR